MSIRRVVTGHSADGRAVFVSDAEVHPFEPTLMAGAAFYSLWGADDAAVYPDDGSRPETPQYFPGLGGFRFDTFVIPPVNAAAPMPLDPAAAVAEFEEHLPGLMSYMEPDDPGMHTTDTTDFEIVLSGQVILELDNGAEVTLSAGDTVVQNGTRHRWRNPGDLPAVIAVFMVGAHPR